MRRLVISDLAPGRMNPTALIQQSITAALRGKGVVMHFIWKNYPLKLHESCNLVITVEPTNSEYTVTVEELFKTHPRAQSVNPVSFKNQITLSKETTSKFIIDWIEYQMLEMPIKALRLSPQTDTYDVF